jgi:hypothetical protein
MQWNQTLTPALSLSEREREKLPPSSVESLFGDSSTRREVFSLAPSDGERVGARGTFHCIDTAKHSTRHSATTLNRNLANRKAKNPMKTKTKLILIPTLAILSVANVSRADIVTDWSANLIDTIAAALFRRWSTWRMAFASDPHGRRRHFADGLPRTGRARSFRHDEPLAISSRSSARFDECAVCRRCQRGQSHWPFR